MSFTVLIRSTLFAACLGGGSVGVLAQPAPRNPFAPPAAPTAPAEAPAQNAELQFCGFFGTGAGARFCIFNLSTGRSKWQALGQESDDFTIEAFDAELKTVRVSQAGRVLNLKLQAASIAAAAPRTAPTGPVPTAAASQQALVESVRVNPTPADERRRLEAVAAEVRRRRALRQAAAANAASENSTAAQ